MPCLSLIRCFISLQGVASEIHEVQFPIAVLIGIVFGLIFVVVVVVVVACYIRLVYATGFILQGRILNF